MKTLIRFAWVWVSSAMLPWLSFANEGVVSAATGPAGPWGAPAVGLGMALAVMAAATAQGRIASSYMEGISRNPGAEKVMKTQLILSLVFVETLVIFTLLIVLMLLGKIGG